MGGHPSAGIVYFLIPVGYACLFVLGLVAAIVWSFSRTRRHIADCLLVGTLMTLPGIIVAWILGILLYGFIGWSNRVWGRGLSEPVALAIFLMPFLIALACVAGSFWFGASLAIRRRQRKRRRPAT